MRNHPQHISANRLLTSGSPSRFLKSEEVLVVGLAKLKIVLPRNVVDDFVVIQTDGANEMDWLSICSLCFQLKNKVIYFRLNELVSRLFFFKLILAQKLLVQRLERLAYLNVGHIGQRQFVSKLVQQLGGLTAVRRFSPFEHTFDRGDSGCGFSCQSYSAGGESKRFVESREIHIFVLRVCSPALYAASIETRNNRPGLVRNFHRFAGTGAGKSPQENSNLAFQKEAAE